MLLRGRTAVSSSFVASAVKLVILASPKQADTHLRSCTSIISHGMGSQNYPWQQDNLLAYNKLSLLTAPVWCGVWRVQALAGCSGVGGGQGTGVQIVKPHTNISHKISNLFLPTTDICYRFLSSILWKESLILFHIQGSRVVHSPGENTGCLCRSILYHMGIYPVGLI